MEEPRRVHKFNAKAGEDFHLWAMRTEAALRAKKLFTVVSVDVVGTNEGGLTSEQQDRVDEACEVIIRGLGDKPLRICTPDNRNPFKMWSRLKDRYAVANTAMKVQLLSRLNKLRYHGQAMGDYVDSFEEIYNRLESMNCTIEPEIQVATLLASFGDRDSSPYGHLVTALQMATEKPNWETVSAMLLQEFEDKAWATSAESRPSKAEGKALTAGRPRRLQFSRGKFHRVERRTCFECGKQGHIARNCKSRKTPRHDINADHDNEIAAEARLLMATTRSKQPHQTNSGQKSMKTSIFPLLLDSGASEHMVRHSTMLHSARPVCPRTIVLGNGSVVTADTEGDILLQSVVFVQRKARTVFTWLKSALHVPELEFDLISVSALCKDNMDVNFSSHMNTCSIVKDGAVRMEGSLHNRVYYINGRLVEREEPSVSVNTMSVDRASPAMNASEVLWHRRLGHAGVDSIRRLSSQQAVRGLELDSGGRTQYDCEDCFKGKQSRLPNPMNLHRATTVGNVIHSDVCGPMSTTSNGGARYYVSFIDEFSGFGRLIPIAKKSDVATSLKQFLPWFERKFSCQVRKMHSDGGGEYVALEQYLQERGIEQSFALAYAKEQNGVAERFNRTIVESARAMLSHAGLPRCFWAEAAVHATDTRNRFFGPRNSKKSSWELVYGFKPRLDHIKVFGCLAWVHIPAERRKKLDDKAEKGLLLSCKDSGLYKV